MLSVRGALGAERRLLRRLRSYLREESSRLRRLRRFYEKVQALHQDPEASVDNPLLAFSLIKRLHSDWPNIVYSDEATMNTQALHAGLREMEQELPGTEDLDGAARALMRLQDVYALSVKGLASGVFQRAGHPPLYSPGRRASLSADDCFHVGKVAYDTGDYYHSIAWLEEAVSLFRLSYGSWNLEDRSSLEDALDHLAFSYFMLAPERLLHLSCSYETNGSPYLLLQPAKKEMVRIQPYVALYHDFITDAEAETIKGLAGPWLQRSVVASGEKQQKAEYRISKSAWLKDTADPVVRALDRRIAAVTGLDLRPPYAEYLQVVNYGLGGHYEPHFDHATLSAVEAGGSTAFIYANFSVPVVKNAALFWWNLRRNGNGDGDTLHAGCPVLAGDKWGE
ncbi:hypothetical protein DUI87_21782 [Hirundo rustica rustica]|uniref:procollagen-proline 4-dioxygenase n=1 Tax=Hirundo rustica rustica TaxID=333673 RepID=A0A3M0JRN8_HIRRU|nr:hypothetical protein DUI87_21782 [Hirundo rustica rustica]